MPVSRTIAGLAGRLLPPTPIGAGLARGVPVRIAALAVGIIVVALDLRRWDGSTGLGLARLLVPLAGLAVLALLAKEPAATLGLRLRPTPSLRWWAVTTAILLVVSVAIGTLYFLTLWATGTTITVALHAHSWDDVPAAALRICARYPLVEELVYRGVLVPALVPTVGRWGAVLGSGLAFAFLHHLYGNAGPDNQLAGFVLAWAMLRSGCLWVPFALHAGANALVLVLH